MTDDRKISEPRVSENQDTVTIRTERFYALLQAAGREINPETAEVNGVTEKSRTRMAFVMYRRNISASGEIILRALLALISGLNSMTCPKRHGTLYGENTVQS